MGWLENDVALITGAGSGLGRALVQRFIGEGARISALEISPAKAAALEADFGEDIVVTVGDVRSHATNAAAVAAAVARFGKLDVLVGNAGIMDLPGGFMDVPADKLDLVFDEVMSINVLGYILAAHAAAPELAKTRGSMVFTGSSSCFTPGGGGMFYTASKHAVVGVVRELAYQFAPAIRVNAVCPGPMTTDLRGSKHLGTEGMVFAPTDPAIAAGIADKFPLRCMDPADYAGMFVALASRDNSATTTGEIVNAADGLAVRGHMAVTRQAAVQSGF